MITCTIQEVIEILTDKKVDHFSITNLEKQVKYFHQSFFSKELDQIPEEEIEFYIGTIHSVKGETHRSTLLVLDTVLKDYSTKPSTEYWIFDLLKEYFVGNYNDPYKITDVIERNETLKSLKLAYVALSRPTHLTAIAIPAHSIFGVTIIFSTFITTAGYAMNKSWRIPILQMRQFPFNE